MPTATLTLKLDRDIIETGERLARGRSMSLPDLVEEQIRRTAEGIGRSPSNLLSSTDNDYIPDRWAIKVKREPWMGQLDRATSPALLHYQEVSHERN